MTIQSSETHTKSVCSWGSGWLWDREPGMRPKKAHIPKTTQQSFKTNFSLGVSTNWSFNLMEKTV